MKLHCDQPLAVRVSLKTRDQVDSVARRLGLSRSRFLAQLILKGLEDYAE